AEAILVHGVVNQHHVARGTLGGAGVAVDPHPLREIACSATIVEVADIVTGDDAVVCGGDPDADVVALAPVIAHDTISGTVDPDSRFRWPLSRPGVVFESVAVEDRKLSPRFDLDSGRAAVMQVVVLEQNMFDVPGSRTLDRGIADLVVRNEYIIGFSATISGDIIVC